jgi:hypothetical protein
MEPTTSEVTGADVNFEHRSYHCATLTAQIANGSSLTALSFSPPCQDNFGYNDGGIQSEATG